MPQTLEPRQAPPHAWRRWIKDGGKLAWRVAWAVLPVSVLMGLAGGWVARQGMGVGFIAVMALTGLWQAMLLSTAEKAARGQRVNVGTPFQGLTEFWCLPGGQAQLQMKIRAFFPAVLFVLLAAFLGIVGLLVKATNGSVDIETTAAAVPATSSLELLSGLAVLWGVAFFWSWVLQRGYQTAMTNMLVRRHGLDWDSACALDERARDLNGKNLLPIAMLFIVGYACLAFAPLLVFVVELVWVCIVTVAARDVFEQQESLAPMEVPAATGALASVNA